MRGRLTRSDCRLRTGLSRGLRILLDRIMAARRDIRDPLFDPIRELLHLCNRRAQVLLGDLEPGGKQSVGVGTVVDPHPELAFAREDQVAMPCQRLGIMPGTER